LAHGFYLTMWLGGKEGPIPSGVRGYLPLGQLAHARPFGWAFLYIFFRGKFEILGDLPFAPFGFCKKVANFYLKKVTKFGENLLPLFEILNTPLPIPVPVWEGNISGMNVFRWMTSWQSLTNRAAFTTLTLMAHGIVWDGHPESRWGRNYT